MQLPQITEVRGIRVLTSAQIAACYNTSRDRIKQNFQENKSRYVEGKHYIMLVGDELRKFKNEVRNSYPVNENIKNEVKNFHSEEIKARYQFNTSFKYAKSLYLWTEKGALLHAKSLNTDKAWEVYDYLVDFYFQVQGQQEEKASVPSCRKKDKIPHMDNPIGILQILLKVAEEKKIEVKSLPFKSMKSALQGERIGIRTELTVEEAAYELAWELSHAFIHYDGGNMVESPLSKDYNEQADRAARMIIAILNQKAAG